MQTKRGIIYYTDNVLKNGFSKAVRDNLKRTAGDIPIVWVSQKPIDEEPNIVLPGLNRSHKSICTQILAGIHRLQVDVIYMAEHDVLYHQSHFDFIPPKEDVFYYNTNRWWLRTRDGLASYKSIAGSLSQLVAYRGICNDFYTKTMILYVQGIKRVTKKVKNEPGKHNVPELPDYKMELFRSELPNVDIRHNRNFTVSDRFRNDDPDYEFQDEIPGWGRTKGRYEEFIRGLDG